MNKSKIYHNPKDEWYTPNSVIDYVKKQFKGKIDLDPATTEEVARVQEVRNFYTKETNGLDKHWSGNVWLNPPFSDKIDWIKKARHEITKKRKWRDKIRIFILLPMAFETKLWQEHILGNAIIHIPDRRISFIDGESLKQMKDIPFTSVLFEMKGTSPFGSAIVELTKKRKNIYKVFELPVRGKQ